LWIVFVAALAAAPENAADPSTPPMAAAAAAPRKDTDGDGIPDDEEDKNHNGIVDPGESDPREADSDHDNVPDAVERQLGTDPTRKDDVPPIPEPLLIDMVRNLGSGRHELEANILGVTTFSRQAGLQWGPEVEYTPFRNLGVELEMPMRDHRVEALKGAVQYTLGSIDTRRIEFGATGSYSHGVGEEGGRLVSTAIITGVRISHLVQALTILGPTFDFRHARPIAGANLSPSVFLQISRRFTTGLELGYRVSQNEKSVATVLPQIHFNPIANVKVQLGAGVTATVNDKVRPLMALRVSYEL